MFKGITDLNNRDFDPFGDFFNDLNNFRPSSNNNVPQPSQVEDTEVMVAMVPKIVGPPQTPPPSQEKGLLEEYGINITEIARRGNVDPVIGRDEEIIRVIEILNRRTKTTLSLSVSLVLVRQQLSRASLRKLLTVTFPINFKGKKSSA